MSKQISAYFSLIYIWVKIVNENSKMLDLKSGIKFLYAKS